MNEEKYDGSYVNGKQEGYGKYYYANGSRFEGSYFGGKQQGSGTVYYNNNSKFVGTWVNGAKNGTGMRIRSDGIKQIEQVWKNGALVSEKKL